MHIAFAASECVPFSKTGGLADVVGALPRALVAAGHQVSVYVPRYRQTKLADAQTVVRSITIPFDDHYRFCSVVTGGNHSGVQFYFVDYPPFFDREALYGTSAGDYPDNAERFALFSRAVLEASKILGVPNVFHCHDWQSALIPVLLRTQYAEDPAFRDVATVFTIHNMGYQGLFPPDTLPLLNLPWDLLALAKMEFFGQLNFLKGALVFSDFITTVSKKYSQEIQTTEFGFGLEGVLRERAATVSGILNGVDYDEWSPQKDKFIVAKYSPEDLSGKAKCKQDLLAGFRRGESRPTFAGHRDCFSLRSAKRLRPDRANHGSPGARGNDHRSPGQWRQAVRRNVCADAEAVPAKDRNQDRIRQCSRAQDRSGQRHVPYAFEIRTLRPEPDLQP